ncbi:Multidrug resistance protein Stp [Microbacterium sp. Bi128]|nr:Multidrug resistance protein Stp [Microbacterium sp. Bi128]
MVVAFVLTERVVRDPLVPLSVLRRRTIAWGNIAGIIAFATETSVVFLLTLYLQNVRGFSPLQAGLVFAVVGAGTVVGGLVAPRIIARIGATRAIVMGLVVQAAATLPLAFLDLLSGWLVVVLIGTFVGGVANLVAIVGFMVTATTGIRDQDQGLATGLATMSQQIGITVGTPVMSAIVAASAVLSAGVGAALVVNAAICVGAAVVVGVALRTRHSPRR